MDQGNHTQLSPALGNCTVDTSYRFLYYQVSYSLIFVLGLGTNALALRRLWRSPPTLSSTAVYMVNLSVADLFFVISLPLRIFYYHRVAPWSLGPPKRPGATFCQLTFMLKYISLYGGIFFLLCIAVDRYFAVVHPLSRRARSVRTARLLSAALWCLVLALSLALPVLRSAAGAGGNSCLLDPSSPWHRGFILAALVLVQAAFLLPAAALLYSYCAVVRVLRQANGQPMGGRRRPGHRRHQRTLTVIYWALGIFLLCFAPYHLNLLGYTLTHLGLLPYCRLAAVTKAFHPVALSLASANCCLNPLLYYFSCHLLLREGGRGGQQQPMSREREGGSSQ